MVLFKEIPQGLKYWLKPYRKIFSKPQYKNFQIFTAGLIASPKKTIQEINDAFSKGEQSSLNRFITKSEWDIDAVNPVRLQQIKKKTFIQTLYNTSYRRYSLAQNRKTNGESGMASQWCY